MFKCLVKFICGCGCNDEGSNEKNKCPSPIEEQLEVIFERLEIKNENKIQEIVAMDFNQKVNFIVFSK